MRASVWAANRASTQPVSRSVPVPLPQTSSLPLNTVLLAAFWQLRLVIVGSRMENVLPDWVVLMLNGFGPFQTPVPLPRITCSWVPSPDALPASTYTVTRLTPSAPTPSTVDPHASRAESPRACTTRREPSTADTEVSCCLATASAAA